MESSTNGIVGLRNIGNTCYGNSILQAVRHQIDFTMFLLQEKHIPLLKKKKTTEQTTLLENYGTLVKSLWNGSESHVDTKPFWGSMIPAAIRAGFDQFRRPIPHDAHEFLVFLLDQFHEALSEEVSMNISSSASSKPLVKQALEAWKRLFQTSYSPFVELLFGLQMRTVTCDTCTKKSLSWESFNMLKVSVPERSGEPLSLVDLLVKEGEGDEIEDYACETCKPTRTRATVKQEIWRLGTWVIVVLKRNSSNGRRINTHVQIPFLTTFSNLFVDNSPEVSRVEPYELYSTIHHHGSSGGGHYTCHARHPVKEVWVHYDDETTYELQKGKLPTLDASTYITMYRRVSK